MSARGGLRTITASVEREVSRLATLQATREQGTERGRGAAWSKLARLLTWMGSPGITLALHGASAAIARLRSAAVLDQGLAGHPSARYPRRWERRGALERGHVVGNGGR